MTAGDRITVVIVDDHAMVRAGLRMFLSSSPGIDVIGEACDGKEAVDVCVRLRPDVVLMDMSMPVMDGAAATGSIKAVCPSCQVIILTSFVDNDKVARALEAGAISYLLKDAGADKVVAAIRLAHLGRGTIDSSAAQALVFVKAPEPKPTLDTDLSKRERQILSLLAGGLGNQAIADRLDLGTGTVRTHVSNILAKLGATNRTAAAMLAMEYGLVDKQRQRSGMGIEPTLDGTTAQHRF